MSFNSIRIQLLAGLLFPLVTVVIVQLWFAYRAADATAQSVTDRLLLASARSIAEQLSYGEGVVEAVVPPSALGMFDLGYGDTVFYRVSTSDGRLLAGYPELDAPYPSKPTDRPEYVDGRFRGQPIRLVVVMQPIPAPNRSLHGFVIVAETLRGENALRTSIWVQSSRQQTLLVIVALAVAWLVLQRGLSPLLRLSDEVEARRLDEYRPFGVAALQVELRPFVTALNGYMLRLQHQVDAQRRFTANAAHQLRTPLTLLRTQASYALRGSEGERLEAIRAILSTTRQLARLTNQLLALARSERHRETLHQENVDLSDTMREILEEHGPLAVDRQLDLSFDVEPGETPVVRADVAAVRDLMVNVIDNAVRYTPPGGQVTVTVGGDAGACFVRVEDTGPGIPAAERDLVFERFYRVRDGQSDGSGLGLAIVKEIVDAHGAGIALRERVPGPGLVVEIRFARAAR